MTSTSKFWDGLSRDLEDPVLRAAFAAASEEIAAKDGAANAAEAQHGVKH